MMSDAELAFYQAVIAGEADAVAASLAAHPELISWQATDFLNKPDTTALHLNTRYRAGGQLEKADAVFDVLMTAGADVNARCRGNWTPVMFAAGNGDMRMLTALLRAGADPLLVNKDGGSALAYAAQHGHIDCARMLIARGIPVEARDNEGRTALFHARYARESAPGMIRFLIEQGASPDVKDNAGKSLAEVALAEKFDAVAPLYGQIAIEVVQGRHRDAAVLKDGIPKPLPVRRALRLKNSPRAL